ncbi:MAG: hypothetical protein HFJ10_03560 [Lachnospiraceae bacterium]|nr:hypothetical protein [Lachnospiraceae bacterium]
MKRAYQFLWEPLNQMILFLGRHSFAVYMVHMKVKDKMVEIIPFTGRYLGYLILMTVVVAAVSLVIGVVLDITVLAGLKGIIEKAFNRKRVGGIHGGHSSE